MIINLQITLINKSVDDQKYILLATGGLSRHQQRKS
jgi:hypothetical protein